MRRVPSSAVSGTKNLKNSSQVPSESADNKQPPLKGSSYTGSRILVQREEEGEAARDRARGGGRIGSHQCLRIHILFVEIFLGKTENKLFFP